MSHFSFTIKTGDSFVGGWGVSTRSFLKWSGKKKGGIKKVKAEVSDSKLKSSMLKREKTIKPRYSVYND